MRFVTNQELVSVEGDYQQVTFNSDYTFLFSKQNIDALPVTTTAVTKVPCLDPTRSSDYITLTDLQGLLSDLMANGGAVYRDEDGEFYPLELDRYDFSREE